MERIQVRRTIIYSGDLEWLEKVLAKSIKLNAPLYCGGTGEEMRTVTVLDEDRRVISTDKSQSVPELPHGA